MLPLRSMTNSRLAGVRRAPCDDFAHSLLEPPLEPPPVSFPAPAELSPPRLKPPEPLFEPPEPLPPVAELLPPSLEEAFESSLEEPHAEANTSAAPRAVAE